MLSIPIAGTPYIPGMSLYEPCPLRSGLDDWRGFIAVGWKYALLSLDADGEGKWRAG
jgi:hypothetical protein